MIRFIDRHRDHFGVEAICRVLSATECGFITSRGYRAAKHRGPSLRAVRDELLIEELKRIHAENYNVYGYRKMWHAMRRAGWDIGRDQTARLMRQAGLVGVRRGRKPVTTTSSVSVDVRPDLVDRDFSAARPHQVWVADITYVRLPGRFCYTAFITDVCTRMIVGWSVAESLHTEALPLQVPRTSSPSNRRSPQPRRAHSSFRQGITVRLLGLLRCVNRRRSPRLSWDHRRQLRQRSS